MNKKTIFRSVVLIILLFVMGLFGKLKSAFSGRNSNQLLQAASMANRFDEIKNRIYPWIKVTYPSNEDSGQENTITLKDNEQPVYKEWLGDLRIFYVVDEGNLFIVLNQKHLPENITVDELHEIALSNLERDVEFKFHQTDFGAWGITAGGDHETGALCIAGVWEWCSDQLKDDLIVSVPAKDLVLMVPASDNEKVQALESFVTGFFKTGERLLTKQLYLYKKASGQWTVWGKAE